MSNINQVLHSALKSSLQDSTFSPIITSIAQYLHSKNIPVDRIQIPMNMYFGFLHPLYKAFIVTWQEDNIEEITIPHDGVDAVAHFQRAISNTPYAVITLQGHSEYQVTLNPTENPYPILDNLYTQGYREYYCMGLPLPHQDRRQIISLATKSAFPENFSDIMQDIKYAISLTLYGFYQSSVSRSIAHTYLGIQTGDKVLQGQIFRGSKQEIDAGILFCDIRGFTSLSESLGADKVVSVVNEIFQCISDVVEQYNGEILKFIGDAMLIIVPQDDFSHRQLGQILIEIAQKSVSDVSNLSQKMNLPLAVGFGAHIGEVHYGNIGSQNRLDFTVMGPAVNLTSRLESMCKDLKASLNVSEHVAQGNEDMLKYFGEHFVKGVSEPVKMWGLPVEN